LVLDDWKFAGGSKKDSDQGVDGEPEYSDAYLG